MADMTWKVGSDRLDAFGVRVSVDCIVRDNINGLRERGEVIYSTNKDGSKGVPCYPPIFPAGQWHVTRPRPRVDPYLAPYFIPTNARCQVDEWTVIDGQYGQKTGRRVWCHAFGIHHSISRYTLGCIRVISEDALLWLVDQVNDVLDQIHAIDPAMEYITFDAIS